MNVYFNHAARASAVNSITWEGDLEQASRIVDITVYLEDISDYIKPGTNVEIKEGTELIFDGKVYRSDLDEGKLLLKLRAYDPLYALAKSSINKKLKNMTASQMTVEIAQEFELKCNSLVSCTEYQTIYAIGYNAYQVIKEAYDKEALALSSSINIVYDEGIKTFNSMESVVKDIFDSTTFIISSNAQESIENVIIEATLITDQGVVIETAINENDKLEYGLNMPRIAVVSSGDAKASDLLVYSERSNQIECIGDIRCTTGKIIRIYEKRSNKIGRFLIESDTHQFNADGHTMQLNVKLISIEGD